MREKVFERLSAAGKSMLTAVSTATLAVPLLMGVINAPQTRAQSTPPLPFEVASVKENKGGDPRSIRMQYLPGGRFSATAIPLRWLIAEAYGLGIQSSRMSFESDSGKSLGSGQYDIEAVAPNGAVPADATGAVQRQIVRRMLQTLLADRFKLVVRRQTKELPVYAIIVAKNGPKLRRSALQEKDCNDNLTTIADGMPCHRFNGGRGRGLHGDAVNMLDLAEYVENWTDHPIVDRTGLTGLYNIQTPGWRPLQPVELPNDGRPPSAEQLAFADPSTPTVFDIFEELGLKLDLQKAPIETIVLVSIQRPSEN
ncbi:MAG TPA: TIGR03435 family protein [Terriglobia bacterium]|nr:TIGR03435 family protein [Terriglobia bacterium]